MKVYHGVRKVYHSVKKVYHDVRKVYHGVRKVYHGIRKEYHLLWLHFVGDVKLNKTLKKQGQGNQCRTLGVIFEEFTGRNE